MTRLPFSKYFPICCFTRCSYSYDRGKKLSVGVSLIPQESNEPQEGGVSGLSDGCSWAGQGRRPPSLLPLTAGPRPKVVSLDKVVHLPAGYDGAYQTLRERYRSPAVRILQPGNNMRCAFHYLRLQHAWPVLSETRSLLRGLLDWTLCP